MSFGWLRIAWETVKVILLACGSCGHRIGERFKHALWPAHLGCTRETVGIVAKSYMAVNRLLKNYMFEWGVFERKGQPKLG